MNRSNLSLLLPLSLALTAGCPATPSTSDNGVPRDFHMEILDLVQGSGDMAGAQPDLTMSGNMDGAGAKNDLTATAGDAATSGDGGGGCIQLATWPTVKSAGNFDGTNGVSYVLESDAAGLPYKLLSVEDWVSMGETHPKMVTYDSTVTYNGAGACEVCTLISACTTAGCANKFFAQAGTMTVTRADRAASGRMTASGSNLKLVEWDFMTDKPVPNGVCYLIGTATFDVMWTAADGGAGADMTGVPGDLVVAPGDMVVAPGDMSMPAVDLKGATSDMTSASGDMASGACKPVVNEVQTAGTGGASDEFVEIFNPCASSVNMTGWKLNYRSAGNNSGGADIAAFSFTQTIAAGGYLLISGAAFTGATPDGALATGLAAGGGAVGLRDGNGVLVDSVAYDVLTIANNFTEGTPAPNPPSAKSIARTPNGKDANNNSLDFKVATPTPKATN